MKKLVRELLYKSAPRAYYSIFLNALGLNVIRACWYNTLWRLRGGCVHGTDDVAIQDLEDNGITIITDFLSKDDYAEIMTYYEKADLVEQFSDNLNVPQYASRQISTPLKLYEKGASDVIIRNKRLRQIIEITSRKKLNLFPKMTFEKFYVNDEKQINGDSPDMTDEAHYDVPFNSMRAFLYLKPCDEQNAAFVFGKGTHKLNSKRLKFEYFDSIKQSVKRRAFPKSSLDSLDKDLLDEIGYVPTHAVGKANSLVIFNTMGIHKRGKFKTLGTREALLIDFRTMDTPLNSLIKTPLVKQALRYALSRS